MYAVEIRVRAQPGIKRLDDIAGLLLRVRRKRQCGEMLVPAGLPDVLDIAHDCGIANIQRTGEAPLHLPFIAIIAMPIKLESKRKLEIEHMNASHRRTAIVQLDW